jgi:hypothetical protein
MAATLQEAARIPVERAKFEHASESNIHVESSSSTTGVDS